MANKSTTPPPTSLVPKTSSGLAMPSFVKTGVTLGVERIGADDLKTPFLRLSQDKTPAVEAGKMGAGVFYDSVTGQEYGPSLVVVPILLGRGRMWFEKFNKGGDILCTSHNGVKAEAPNGTDKQGKPTDNCLSCVNAVWGVDEPPLCSEQGNYLVLVPGEKFPKKMVLQRSSYGTHRKLATSLNAAALGSNAPVFAFKVKLSAIKNKKGVLIIDADLAGPLAAEDETVYTLADQIYEQMHTTFFHGVPAGTETLANEE